MNNNVKHNTRFLLIFSMLIILIPIVAGCIPTQPSVDAIQTAIAQTQIAQPIPSEPQPTPTSIITPTPIPISEINLEDTLIVPNDVQILLGDIAPEKFEECLGNVEKRNKQYVYEKGSDKYVKMAEVSWDYPKCDLGSDFNTLPDDFMSIDEIIYVGKDTRDAARMFEELLGWYDMVMGSLEEEKLTVGDSRIWISKGPVDWNTVYATHDNCVILLYSVGTSYHIKEDLLDAINNAIKKIEELRNARSRENNSKGTGIE